ncbi:MAG: hypothetical protein ACWIPH_02055 [Ostreibacterium sp.]
MSLMENESTDSVKNKKYAVTQIAKILREDYKESGSVVKWIARHTGASEHAVRNWYDAAREPSIENFISLTKASPRLVKWFLGQVGREDLTQLIQKQNRAAESRSIHRDLDIANLIFETEGSCDLLVKLQKLTLRQLWFYTQIKDGRKLCAKDLILVFNISRATAYRDIDELVKLSLLCRVGQGKLEYYTTL